jgi:hypothetical protein
MGSVDWSVVSSWKQARTSAPSTGLLSQSRTRYQRGVGAKSARCDLRIESTDTEKRPMASSLPIVSQSTT